MQTSYAHGDGTERKTLDKIEYYPEPQEIIDKLNSRQGWEYQDEKTAKFYQDRDKALAALLYLGALRASEALRIKKNQFINKGDHILIRAIKLSKCRVEGRPRRKEYREAQLPLTGPREPLSRMIMNYVQQLDADARLFPFSLEKTLMKTGKDGKPVKPQTIGTKRMWQIVHALLPEFTEHWLRAFGEDYLYDQWEHDILAVSDYVKVDPRTLQEYLRKRHEKYNVV